MTEVRTHRPPSGWPGIVAIVCLLVATSFWTFWGVSEMFWEGWGLPFPQPLFYLIPGAACLLLSVVAVAFPTVGGVVVLLVGGWFTWWWWSLMYHRGAKLLGAAISTFPGSAILILVGLLCLLEGRRRRALAGAPMPASGGWLRRHARYVAVVGIPLAIAVVVVAVRLPPILRRHDDGIRAARVIVGNGVRLLWAPAGPGWNWKQPGGWILSWDHLATYGQDTPGVKTLKAVNGRFSHSTVADMKATGLCGYLTEDGKTLADHPLGIWRMPTADEMVRSLSRDGKNAGCAWSHKAGFAPCRLDADKETPLWAPEQSPIYYWAAEESAPDSAWYVAYNGAVQHQPKNFGNPRHGYRCVREVPAGRP